ncbi:MAG TPA: hypothetical protein VFQ79_24580 [Bryobacteraceae bacterium]|nr:hypothetical protein [Bryobacteraceae bacterium]
MNPNKEPDNYDILWHQCGVSPRGEPFVQLLRGDQIIGQMSPEQARDFARAITEAAEAAEPPPVYGGGPPASRGRSSANG